MFKEFSVNNHVVHLHTVMFVCNILIPETVIIVPVIYRLSMNYLHRFSFNFMDLSIWFSVKVSLATFYFRFNLEIRNVLFLFKDFCALSVTFTLLHSLKHSLCHRESALFIVIIINSIPSENSHKLFFVFNNFVL